jgi:hypothetical protein
MRERRTLSIAAWVGWGDPSCDPTRFRCGISQCLCPIPRRFRGNRFDALVFSASTSARKREQNHALLTTTLAVRLLTFYFGLTFYLLVEVLGLRRVASDWGVLRIGRQHPVSPGSYPVEMELCSACKESTPRRSGSFSVRNRARGADELFKFDDPISCITQSKNLAFVLASPVASLRRNCLCHFFFFVSHGTKPRGAAKWQFHVF